MKKTSTDIYPNGVYTIEALPAQEERVPGHRYVPSPFLMGGRILHRTTLSIDITMMAYKGKRNWLKVYGALDLRWEGLAILPIA